MLGSLFLFDAWKTAEPTMTGVAINFALVTAAAAPTVSMSDPRWGAGGTTDLSADEVATGGVYTGPITIGGPGSGTTANWVDEGGGDFTMYADNVALPGQAASPVDGRWGILYMDDANKRAVGFLDLGGDVDLVNQLLRVIWSPAGLFTKNASVYSIQHAHTTVTKPLARGAGAVAQTTQGANRLVGSLSDDDFFTGYHPPVQ